MELRKADVVCIVYSVDDEDTLDSVTDHWLPFIERTLGMDHRTPIILVGNKVDMVDYSTMDLVLPIMNDFEEIETCVECSAKTLKNISEMFYFAQKAVLHPSAPLWNYNEKDVRFFAFWIISNSIMHLIFLFFLFDTKKCITCIRELLKSVIISSSWQHVCNFLSKYGLSL